MLECVEIDASKQLVHEFRLQASSRDINTPPRLTTVKVIYQWKPRMCSFCKVFGHMNNACPSQPLPTNLIVYNGKAPVHSRNSAEALSHSHIQLHTQDWQVVGRKGKNSSPTDCTATTDCLSANPFRKPRMPFLQQTALYLHLVKNQIIWIPATCLQFIQRISLNF